MMTMTEENQTNESQDQETIGNYLKKMREKKKLTVKIISQHTKINSTKLELLEANNFSELPNQAYVMGYVKSYSKTLGLDQKYCLELLDKAYGKSHGAIAQQQLERLSQADKPRVEESGDNPLAKIVAGVAALAVVVGILAFLSQREQNNEVVDQTSLAEESMQAEAVLDEEENVTVTEVAAETKLAPQVPDEVEVVIEKEEEIQIVPPVVAAPVAPTPIVEAPKKETFVKAEVKVEAKEAEKKTSDEKKSEINFRPIIGPTYSLTTISNAEKDLVYPQSLRSSGVDGEYHVYIKADTDDTWITYKTDSEDVRRFVLQKDRHVILRGKIHRIFLGNANATKIFVNQQLIDVETRTGVKSIVIPNEVRTDYVLPLFVYPPEGEVLTSDEYEAANPS